MDNTVDVTIPVDAEAAKALEPGPARRSGRPLLSAAERRARPRCPCGGDRRGQARSARHGLTDEEIDAELDEWRAERRA